MKVSIINLSLDNDPLPISLDVDPETQLGTLKSLVEVELRIPILRQELVIDGKTNHDDNKTLQDLNVKEHDIIGVRDRRGVTLGLPSSPGIASEVDAFRHVARAQASRLMQTMSQPQNMRHLEQTQPVLAQAVRNNDVEALVDELIKTWQAVGLAGGQDPGALRAAQDPLSAEAQKYMLEQIRREAVDQNRAFACEVMPEAFGEVVMLYIRVEVNGTPVLAFVDSGAQSTIMSEACAQRCGLERIIDRRYQGTAMGVGSARVVGRIHLAQLKCGGVFFPSSFTILENQKVDLLFGLDLLQRHQCCIDLRQQKLFLGTETSVPFCSEAEIRESTDQALLEKIINSPTASPPALASGTPAVSQGGEQRPDGGISAANQSGVPGNRIRQAMEALQAANQPRRRDGVHTQDQLNYGGQMIEESKVKQLVDLGFDRQRVQQVLRECRGDTEMAAARLAFG